MPQKYNLGDVTKEETEIFMKDFQELLDKHSLYFEPCPQFTRKDIGSPWEVTIQVLLQKKIENKDETIKKD